LRSAKPSVTVLYCDGRVAQLGERIHGMDEVAGSIPVTSTNFQFHSTFNNLFQNFGGEAGEEVVFHGVSNLYGIAADFAILDVSLAANGKIQYHRNFFPAIWTMEEMFHRNGPLLGDPNAGTALLSAAADKGAILAKARRPAHSGL
jgi:hypothetical protein